MILETERLILRRPEPRDQDPSVNFFMSERAVGVGGPYSLGQAWRHFAYELGHWEIYGYGMRAVTLKEDESLCGLIGPWNPPDWPEREIGWFVFDNAEGKGIAYEAAKAAIADAWARLNWTSMVSYIMPGITRSIALAERVGATLDETADYPGEFPCLVYRHHKEQS